MTNPTHNSENAGKDHRTVSGATLDATGFENTLHVLEGIAAEGREWIHHERRREEHRLGRLVGATEATVN